MDRRTGLKVGWLEIELNAAAVERSRWPVELQAEVSQVRATVNAGERKTAAQARLNAEGARLKAQE